MSSIPTAVDDVTLINASYLNSIKGAVEDLEDGTVPAGSLDIDGLPSLTDPVQLGQDLLPIHDASSSTVKHVQVGDLGLEVDLGNPAASGYVLSSDTAGTRSWIAAGGSGLVLASTMDGRLTLTSGTPITTSDVTAASTIYLTPYVGDQVALYDGSAWQYHTLTERSLSLSGLTSGANYDVWLYDNSGTLTLELSTAWTNDTTRADAVATQDGVRVKSGAPERRLVGTIRTTGTTTTEDSNAKRFVRNERHPVRRKLLYEQTGTTWTYNSSTWRRANNNASAEVYALTRGTELVQVNYWIRANQSSAVSRIGVGVDSLTPATEAMAWSHESGYNHIRATSTTYPAEGYHYWPAVESVETSGTAGYAANGYIVGEVLA